MGQFFEEGRCFGKGVDAWKIEGYYYGLCDLHNQCESEEIYARTTALDRGHCSLNKTFLLCALSAFQVKVKDNGIVMSDKV